MHTEHFEILLVWCGVIIIITSSEILRKKCAILVCFCGILRFVFIALQASTVAHFCLRPSVPTFLFFRICVWFAIVHLFKCDIPNTCITLCLSSKTRTSLVPAVSEYLNAEHSYDLPEVLVVPVSGGSKQYLEWVRTEATGKSRDT